MDKELRNDLTEILLIECYGRHEKYARALIAKSVKPRSADQEALDEIDNALNRINARCSKIEG